MAPILQSILTKAKKQIKRGFVTFAEQDAPEMIEKAVRHGARFIKKNWRTRGGRSLLLERSGMFTHKKRRTGYNTQQKYVRSGSRSTSRGRRSAAATALVPYRRSRSRSTSSSVSAYNSRAGVTYAKRRTVMHRNTWRLKRAGVLRRLKKELSMGEPYSVRRMGEATMGCSFNNREFYTGRLYNWSCMYDGVVQANTTYVRDFGQGPNESATSYAGFLSLIQGQYISGTAGLGDRYAAIAMFLSQWKHGIDMDRKVRMTRARMQYHWKNNSGIQVTMHFYTFKAMRDIPADSAGDPTISFQGAWYQSLQGSDTTNGVGISNIDDPNDLKAFLTAYPSDNPAGMRPWYKIMSHRKIVLQPGDEAKQNISMGAKTFSMQDLYYRQVAANDSTTASQSNGFYMLKGDLGTFTILEGGIVHQSDETNAVYSAGSAWVDAGDGASVDLIVKKEFVGQVLPQTSVKFTRYYDDRPGYQATYIQQQTIPAYTSI